MEHDKVTMMLGSAYNWVQIICVAALAILTKEYFFLRSLLQDAKKTGICEVKECPPLTDPLELKLEGKFQRMYQHQQKQQQGSTSSTVAGRLEKESSSVQCQGTEYNHRLCTFRHLCYLPQKDEYVMFHGPGTVLWGVPADRHAPPGALLDMSTVADHNGQLFTYTDLPVSSAAEVLRNAVIVNITTLIMKPFNPDNIMHALHDDLLPAYHTLLLHGEWPDGSSGRFQVQLAFMEGGGAGPHLQLYQLLSDYRPLLLSDIQAADRPLCFSKAYVGLSKHTTWYQYGFSHPQGPIQTSSVTAQEIRQFTGYISAQLGVSRQENQQSEHTPTKTAVILTRQQNRLLLNQLELTMALARELQVRVVTLSLEDHSLADIVDAVTSASLLISMHGSLLSLAMFLQPGSALLELFPYAVNPEQYSPYKTLAGLRGMGLVYAAWRNSHVENTRTHPTNPWDTGGIAHLPQSEQARIKESTEVPPHLCCRDPEWLYRIYQDTIVDVPEVLSLARKLLQQATDELHELQDEQEQLICERITPGHVLNLTCSGSGSSERLSEGVSPPYLSLSWSPPWNLQYLHADTVQYEVWLQQVGAADYSAWIMSRTQHVFTADSGGVLAGVNYSVWVRTIVDEDQHGPFNSQQVKCLT